MANQDIVNYKFRPKVKWSAEIVLASESGCSWPYFANITALFRRNTMMVFHKVSSVAGWMGNEDQGGWKIVLSSRCRTYIIALYTLLSWQQPLCSTAGKKTVIEYIAFCLDRSLEFLSATSRRRWASSLLQQTKKKRKNIFQIESCICVVFNQFRDVIYVEACRFEEEDNDENEIKF